MSEDFNDAKQYFQFDVEFSKIEQCCKIYKTVKQLVCLGTRSIGFIFAKVL
jgi:hypothetical protein